MKKHFSETHSDKAITVANLEEYSSPETLFTQIGY